MCGVPGPAADEGLIKVFPFSVAYKEIVITNSDIVLLLVV